MKSFEEIACFPSGFKEFINYTHPEQITGEHWDEPKMQQAADEIVKLEDIVKVIIKRLTKANKLYTILSNKKEELDVYILTIENMLLFFILLKYNSKN